MQPFTPKKQVTAANSFSFARSTSTSFTHDSAVEDSFQDLSHKYNLQLTVPDRKILERSPQKQRELAEQGLEDRDATIYRRFRIHFRTKTLDLVLNTYGERVKVLCEKWVRKPRGEPDVTPRKTILPKATNPWERDELKRLLDQVLQEHRPNVAESRLTLRSGRELPALDFKQSGRTTRFGTVKRTSNEFSEKIGKRAKNSAGGQHVSDQTSGSSMGVGRDERNYFDLSTNVSQETVVFSDHGRRVSQGTQTTVEASSQEKARRPPAQSRSFSVSSSSIQAPEESFDHAESHPQLHEDVRQFLDSSSPLHTYSDFGSLLPDHELVQLEDSFAEPDITEITSPAILELEERLQASWPRTPPGLAKAPFPVLWEVLRVLLHCKVEISTFELEYEQSWTNQNHLWRILHNDPSLAGKTLPEKSSAAAWDAALANFYVNNQAVILVLALTPATGSSGAFFQVQLHALKIDNTHRLARRFGPDRFIEMIVPSIDRQNMSILKMFSEETINYIRRWVFTNVHPMSGRFWKPFFVRSIREGPIKKAANKGDWVEPGPKQLMKYRFYLFAQDGNDFQAPSLPGFPVKNEPIASHTKSSVTSMIRWLLEPSENADQPSLKLFSRISLGLSRTEPTIILEKSQLRHVPHDILSPTGKVMNDGIGRMSPNLARQIRDSLCLTETPAGFQGRIGSAKGFWILDVSDRSNDVWLETYPSQRKWNCNFNDEDHRTFEVSSYPQLLASAGLNTQFLPILMQQASTKRKREALKEYLSDLLIQLLNDEIEAQRIAMQDPLSCSAWVDRNSTSRRVERLNDNQVPRLGSMPRHDEDRIQFFLAAGFNPLKQKMLWDMIWKLCKDKCEELKKRINIKVGRSIYAYMVIDFEGILAEDEVQVSFSSNFKDELSGFSDTLLHGMDILVARSPAHFVSDIQKVRAVFKPELGALKDVIVFPSTGNTPLADKLSGGDYDGDMAWVCWDPDIVSNFDSALVPDGPDLVKEGYLSKQKGTYRDLIEKHQGKATLKFLEDGFDFNMQPSFLGLCTIFKENLCYQRHSYSDATAIRLSTMLSNLVDQSKQGIVLTASDFSKFKRSLLGKNEAEPPPPRYKADSWAPKDRLAHIIDYLKFNVMIPTVDAELDRLSKSTQGHKAEPWDEDLAFYWHYFNDLRVKGNRRIGHGMEVLQNDIEHFHRTVDALRANEDLTFDEKVWRSYKEFQLIKPRGFAGTVGDVITVRHPEAQQHTEWDLLRASTYYKFYYWRSNFIWWIIGSELQEIKAKASRIGPIVIINASTYAAMRHDPKYIRTRNAKLEGLQDPFHEEREPWEE
ncbi:hypothetical protein TruAng_001251 [Truncatella angustata]|nr:hypothetical protein TruAng_001251 [Truncatella angustata]